MTLRTVSRREFLRLAVAGGATSLLLGQAAAAAFATPIAAPRNQSINFTNPGASTASWVATPQKGGKLLVGSGGTIESTDPHKVFDLQHLFANKLFTQGLVDYDNQLQPLPGVCDKWAISDDFLTYSFRLRDGVKWTNGQAITADHLVWNFNRMIDLKGQTTTGEVFEYLPKEGVKAFDSQTLQLTLTQPFSPFLTAMGACYSMALIHPDSKISQDTVQFPIGVGPYELVEMRPKEVMKFRKFKDNYRGMTDGFDEIEVRNLSDDQVRISALRAGDVDWINLVPDSEIDRLQSQETDKITTLIYPDGIFWIFVPNHTKPPFDNQKVCKAMQLAHDGKQVAEATTLGHGEAYEQPFVKASNWHLDKVDWIPQRDVAKAKQLLAEAGLPNGFSFKLLISSSWYVSMRPSAQVFQAQLAEAGMQVEIEDVEFGTMIDRQYKMDFDSTNIGWEIQNYDPDNYFYQGYHPNGPGWVFSGKWNNPDGHKLILQARTEQVFEKRKALYAQVEKLLLDDGAITPSYRLSNGFAWKANLSGFTQSFRGDYAHATGGIIGMVRSG